MEDRKMKLKAQKVPYSSVVGGGVLLTNEKGAAQFQIAIFGTTNGITKEQTGAISTFLVDAINKGDLLVEVQ